MPRSALVTNALPYANGQIHLGHLVGYIQADIWVRARRMSGDENLHALAAALPVRAVGQHRTAPRRQQPPGVKITPKAFGRDRRMPITNRYRNGPS